MTMMTAYHTVTTPTVMPPKKPITAPLRKAALQELMGMGHTPAQAMAILERKDGHRKAMPPLVQSNEPVPNNKRHTRIVGKYNPEIMQVMSAKLVTASDVAGEIGTERPQVFADMMAMATDGLLDRKRSGSNVAYQFRKSGA